MLTSKFVLLDRYNTSLNYWSENTNFRKKKKIFSLILCYKRLFKRGLLPRKKNFEPKKSRKEFLKIIFELNLSRVIIVFR